MPSTGEIPPDRRWSVFLRRPIMVDAPTPVNAAAIAAELLRGGSFEVLCAVDDASGAASYPITVAAPE